MKKILVTGGTVFVSRYIAEYYVKKNCEVYVLNRNHHPQSEGVHLIQADRNELGEQLRNYSFDVVIDTAYTANDIDHLLNALGEYKDYILISSSAVYPETNTQPFQEESKLGLNTFWGKYGTDKIEAETLLQKRNPNAYILRPPYIYGCMNNVYREGFVFDCALANRKFYLPRKGEMKLQFFSIEDLCRFIDILLEKKPERHIFNVGNTEQISVRDWVELCYKIVGKKCEFVEVFEEIGQRNYFCFSDYEYMLDVSAQNELLKDTQKLEDGLQESYAWYRNHEDQVRKRPYLEYILENMETDKL